MDRLAGALGKKLMMDSAAVVQSLADSAFCRRFGYDTATIACLFVPDTYEVYWNVSLDNFMKRMQKEHDRFWNEERRRKAAEAGLTPEEVVTLASIVDEETANNGGSPWWPACTSTGCAWECRCRPTLLSSSPSATSRSAASIITT